MNNVIELKRKPEPEFEQVRDSKGNPVPRFFVLKSTGMIYYREKFGRLDKRIPPLNKPTGEKTLSRARTAAEKLRTDWINQHQGKTQAIKTVAEVVQDILERHTPTLRTTTQRKQRFYLEEIRGRFGQYDINTISARDYETWVRELLRRGSYQRGNRVLKRETFDDYTKHMNLLTRWAHDNRITTHMVRFKNPGGKRTNTGRVYTPQEIKALWDVMSDETRDKFVLSYECMMRLREALFLTWDRIDLSTGKVTLRPEDVKTGSKTGKGREFILSRHALQRLKRRRRYILNSRYVFPSPVGPDQPVYEVRHAWEVAKKHAKIKGRARWHDLRHSGLSRALLEAKISPVLVSEYAGVSIATIQRVYLHSKADHTASVAEAISIPGADDEE